MLRAGSTPLWPGTPHNTPLANAAPGSGSWVLAAVQAAQAAKERKRADPFGEQLKALEPWISCLMVAAAVLLAYVMWWR